MLNTPILGRSIATLVLLAGFCHGNDISVKIERLDGAAPISQHLLGAQYAYSETSIVTQLSNQDLLQSWRNVPIQVMRYPGGTWADHYIWDNPEGGYFASGNVQTVASPEKFIESCRQIGAEPIIQVNTLTRGEVTADRINPTKIEDIRMGAKRAARWVEAANLIDHWHVKYWEIGNEVWVWMKPEEYARYVVEYSKAMRAVDPSIKIIACGLSSDVGPFKASWLVFNDDPNWKPRNAVRNTADAWNQALVTTAKGYFDFIAPHIYIDTDDKSVTGEYRYLNNFATILKQNQLLKSIQWKKAMGDSVKLAITEWSTDFSQSVPATGAYQEGLSFYSLGNGLNAGLLFGQFVKESANIDLTILHSLGDIQTMWFWPKNEVSKKGPLLHPIYMAMQIWGNHLGTDALRLSSPAPPTLKVDGRNYPSLFLYGSEDSAHVYAVIINSDPGSARTIRLSADPSFSLGPQGSAAVMSGAELSSNNWGAWNGAAPLAVNVKDEQIQSSDGTWILEVPAHSMIGITLPKK
jgi:alpha-L-arabinofuranosidase